MKGIVEIRAIVRQEMLCRVICALKDAGIPRLSVTRVHAIGAGVDPASVKISWDEGSEYADKSMVQFICSTSCCENVAELVARAARTGRQGDGIVAVYPVKEVLKIRTGARGLAALE